MEFRYRYGRINLLVGLGVCFAALTAQPQQHSAPSAQDPGSRGDLRALAALVPVDTHTHVAKGDAAFYAMLARLHMHILNILLVDDHDPYRKDLNSQRADAERVIQESHGYASLCTSFDPFQFNNAGFAASAIRGLNQDFMNGAIAVKI